MGEVHAAPSSVKVPGPNATAAARSNGRITKLSGDLCSRSTHASWSILVETDVIVEYGTFGIAPTVTSGNADTTKAGLNVCCTHPTDKFATVGNLGIRGTRVGITSDRQITHHCQPTPRGCIYRGSCLLSDISCAATVLVGWLHMPYDAVRQSSSSCRPEAPSLAPAVLSVRTLLVSGVTGHYSS